MKDKKPGHEGSIRLSSNWREQDIIEILPVFDGIDEVIYVSDPETHELLFANEAFKKRWGNFLPGDKCYKVLQNRDAPCPFCTNDIILGEKPGQAHVWEFQNEITGRWFRCSDKAIRWTDGRMVRLELASDITARKDMESALRRSEQRLDLAIDSSELGLWDLNIMTGKTSSDERSLNMIGFTKEEIISDMNWLVEHIHPDDAPRLALALQEFIMNRGELFECEYRIRAKSGEWKWLLDRAKIVEWDNNGAPVRIMGTHMDITKHIKEEEEKRKDREEKFELERQLIEMQKTRAEKTLEKTESFVRSINDNLFDGMIYQVVAMDDGSRKFTYLSDKVKYFYGVTPEEGMADASLIYGRVHKDDIARVIQEEEKAHKTFSVLKTEARIINHKGELRWSQFISRPVKEEDGTIAWNGIEFDITERKKIEEEQKESEKKFSTAFALSPLLMAISDVETGRYITVNNKFYDVLGYKADEVIGRTSVELGILDINDREGMIGHLNKYGELKSYEIRIKAKNGEIKSGYFHASQISISGKNRLLTIFTDITEHKLLEQKYKTYIESAPSGIFISDAAGKYIEANKSGIMMLGFSVDELKTMSIPDVLAPECIADGIKHFEICRETGKASGELEFQRKDGTKASMTVDATKLSDDRYMAICMDITERKRAEALLQESEKRYRALFDQAIDGIFLMCAEDHKLTMNQSFAKMHGYDSTEEMASMHLDDLDAPETKKLAPERLQRILDGESLYFEVEHYHRDGHIFPLSVSCSLIEIGGKHYFLGFHQDITGRKQAEEELRNYREHLEKLVEERTAALKKTSEQLLQSQKMEAIGQLAGGIAHDFNNIIATISGTAEMLISKTPPDAPFIKQLERIQRGSNRAKDLTMKLLTFARKEKLSVKSVDPREIVSDIIDMLKGTISAKINVSSEFDHGRSMVNIDSNQVFHAILNMCLNACDAMPQGGALKLRTFISRIDEAVSSEQGVECGEYSVIAIEDTGTGIAEDKIEKIFEPFFTTKDRGKGSGLGLSISHGIIKSHGGFIKVRTEQGKGTAFNVYLPVSDSGESAADEEAASEMEHARGSILIIDDDQDFVQMMKESLESKGFDIATALSGQEAINYYRENADDVDLILLDMILPGMNGAEIFFALKKLNAAAKIILCSGYSIEGDASMLLENGAMGFIQKPFDISEVVDVISGKLQVNNC